MAPFTLLMDLLRKRTVLCFVVGSVVAAALMPVQVVAQPSARQMQLLANNCVQCHARPGIGAPVMGSVEDWQAAVTRGEDAMLVNVVHGVGGMPPLGYCSACNEEDFRVMIRFLSGMADAEEGSQ